jgi:arsenate reductase
MAEGILRKLAGHAFEAFSAGSKPTGRVHPLAVRVMQDIGVDVSQQRSKALEEFVGQPFDYVITVCDNAKEACPNFPGAAKQLHWSFDDPAQAEGDDEQKLPVFVWVREEIRARLQLFVSAKQ